MLSLGKKNARYDSRTLKMSHYALASYAPPPFASYTYGITDWGMMMNDTLGDCTIAAAAHAEQVWTQGKTTISNSIVVSAYEQWCGYVLGNPSTDQGGVEIDVLNAWRKSTLGGHVLEAFIAPQPQNLTHVMHSIAEFGGIYIGLQLPNSAMVQNEEGKVWDVVADDGGLAGGHAVFCPAYHTLDPTYNQETTITCITWGGLQKMTTAFWEKYCDESYCLLAAAWEPSGVNLMGLRGDLASVDG